jgi:hypothetical protein
MRMLDFRDYLSLNQESGIMVAINREKIFAFIESQWLYYLHIVKGKGKLYFFFKAIFQYILKRKVNFVSCFHVLIFHMMYLNFPFDVLKFSI